ncbi:MAG: rhomboid family intramembrane serine protease [Actinobacteria bacterium]|nr:rhomboid family intramembrane serine protease [Actinomycetota bacterium]
MSGRFQISFPGRRDHDDPWFRIGALDITTSVLVPGLCVVSMFMWAANPEVLRHLVLFADDVRHGQIWRLLSWPLANEPDIWTALTIAMLWYFGRELERMIGRVKYAWMLVLLAVVPGVVGTLLDINQAGIRPVEIAVFCVFCAQLPDVRFFGGIPAWVFAAVIVGIEVLNLIGLRLANLVLLLAVSLATAALAARAFGILGDYPWIPKLAIPSRRRKRLPRATDQRVVTRPWAGSNSPDPRDQAELDALLDKISARGIDSLSRDEKARLNELSQKLRGR